MKNQYFGDINDYKKYSLIRYLSGNGKLRTLICWMLTEDDKGSDGSRISYLQDSKTWRRYDPLIYDGIRQHLINEGKRNVNCLTKMSILPSSEFYMEPLKDDIEKRKRYFDILFSKHEEMDLFFFDPDNGIEIKSIRKGKKNSSKYLYWDEVGTAFELSSAVMIYQHFPRVDRNRFIQTMTETGRKMIPQADIFTYATSHVLFLLFTHRENRKFILNSNKKISSAWKGVVRINGNYFSKDEKSK